MDIGKRIAHKRKAIKITQTSLADAVGVTTAFISQIESGSRNPSYGLMRKIAHELQASIESLINEVTIKTENPLDKLLSLLIPSLDDDKKNNVINYILTTTGSKYYRNIPLLTSPVEYAQFLIKENKISDVPVDVLKIAKYLGVEIVKADIEDNEGILYKNQERPIILLDNKINYAEREKFTISVLLGNLIIPWHLKQVFYRTKNKRSLDCDDKFEIEARQFAGELMLPGATVKKDFKKLCPSIELFEKFSREKYKCSMTALAHKYSEYYGARALYTTSEKTNFTRTYENGFPYKLVDNIQKGSFAYSFVDEPPLIKETRSGIVEGSIWFKNIPAGIKIIEESMLDPKFGITVTLLQIKHAKDY